MHSIFKSGSGVFWVVKGKDLDLVDGPYFYAAEAQERANELNEEHGYEESN